MAKVLEPPGKQEEAFPSSKKVKKKEKEEEDLITDWRRPDHR